MVIGLAALNVPPLGAVTLTVGSAKFSTRHIALLLVPFMMSPKTPVCRPVRPMSASFEGSCRRDRTST